MIISIEIPEKYIVNQTLEEFSLLLKLDTAIDMYRKGVLSVGAAVEFVGDINRYVFLYECKKRGIEPQTYESSEELAAEVAMLDEVLA